MKHDLEQGLGAILSFAVREAIRYPWQAGVAGLLAVIWVIRRTRGGGSGEAQTPVIVKTGGGLVLAGAAVVGAFVYFTRSKPAKAVATPAPTITQQTINRTIVQHVTHVAAQSHTGLYVLIGIIAVFGIVALIHLINRLTGD